jgi:hypothetical protein
VTFRRVAIALSAPVVLAWAWLALWHPRALVVPVLVFVHVARASSREIPRAIADARARYQSRRR